MRVLNLILGFLTKILRGFWIWILWKSHGYSYSDFYENSDLEICEDPEPESYEAFELEPCADSEPELYKDSEPEFYEDSEPEFVRVLNQNLGQILIQNPVIFLNHELLTWILTWRY